MKNESPTYTTPVLAVEADTVVEHELDVRRFDEPNSGTNGLVPALSACSSPPVCGWHQPSFSGRGGSSPDT